MPDGLPPLPPLPRVVKGARPRFHDEPAIDRLIAMVVALTSEVSVLADRLATLESLSGVGHAAVDSHLPDMAERERREALRDALIGRVFAALEVELEGLASGSEQADYWETISRIERGEM